MSAAAVTARSRRSTWLALVAGLAAFIVLIGLGTWQVERLAWKEGLIATIDERIAAPPRSLADLLAMDLPSDGLDYWPVRVEGEFAHGAERHFFATWKGESGYFVYTPLRLDDGAYVFVNRGFVPFDRKEPRTRAEGQVEGRVAVTGLLRSVLIEKPSSMVPDNDPAANIFYWKDIRAMAGTSGLPKDAAIMAVFVDADSSPNPGGLPVGGVTMIDLPNNHLQYAVTWYGLAAALAGVMIAFLWRRRSPSSPHRGEGGRDAAG